MMLVLVACGIRTCWTLVKPSAWRSWPSIWAWSWDPLKFMRRHPPHHLSPARASYRTGPDPEARLSRPKSPQQRSNQARKPVISEQDSCSLALMSGLSRERYCTVSSNPTLSATHIRHPDFAIDGWAENPQ